MDPSSWAYYTNRLQQTQQPAAAELQQYATQLQVQQLRQVAEQQQQAQAQAQHHQVTDILILLLLYHLHLEPKLFSFRKQHQVKFKFFFIYYSRHCLSIRIWVFLHR